MPDICALTGSEFTSGRVTAQALPQGSALPCLVTIEPLRDELLPRPVSGSDGAYCGPGDFRGLLSVVFMFSETLGTQGPELPSLPLPSLLYGFLCLSLSC